MATWNPNWPNWRLVGCDLTQVDGVLRTDLPGPVASRLLHDQAMARQTASIRCNVGLSADSGLLLEAHGDDDIGFDAGFHPADGEWHEWKIKWQNDTSPRRVAFWLDGVKKHEIADDATVPHIAMKITLRGGLGRLLMTASSTRFLA